MALKKLGKRNGRLTSTVAGGCGYEYGRPGAAGAGSTPREPAMKNLVWMGALLLVATPVMAEDKKDEKFDASKLLGTWEYVSGMKNGEKADIANFKDQKVIFTKDKLTLDGPMKFVMTYELDTTKSPAVIKLTMVESPFGAGAKASGIIEVKGDELKLCYKPEGDAPEKFESKADSMSHLFVLKRVK